MIKQLKIKKLISLLLIFLLSINNFAAVISENDGNAFVTKGEFDALKNDFANIINGYNESIENKLDGSIAEFLSGKTLTKVTENTFPYGAGEKAIACAMTSIDKLHAGVAGLDMKIDLSNMSHYGGFVGSGQINMKRDHQNNYEIFKLSDSGDFEWYSDKAYFDINTAYYHKFQGELGSSGKISATSLPKMRWHGGAYTQAGNNPVGRDRTFVYNVANKTVIYWDDRPNKPNFYVFYCTNYNFGSGYWTGTKIDRRVNANFTLDSDDKIKYIFDQTNDCDIWIKDPNIDKDKVSAYTNPYWDTLPPAGTPGLATGSVTTTFTVLSAGDTSGAQASPRTYVNSAYMSNVIGGTVIWSRDGAWNSTSGKDNCADWYEFIIEPESTIQNENTKNGNINLNGSEFNNYRSKTAPSFVRPYQGYMCQGLPIGLFNGRGTIEFDIDLSTMTGATSIYFALSDNPFDLQSSKGISTYTSLPIGTTLKIDGSTISTGFHELDNKKHKIRIEYDYSDETAIFYTFAIKDTTKKEKAIFTLPKTYKLTSTE